eukprot:gene6333-6403_t
MKSPLKALHKRKRPPGEDPAGVCTKRELSGEKAQPFWDVLSCDVRANDAFNITAGDAKLDVFLGGQYGNACDGFDICANDAKIIQLAVAQLAKLTN